jgi:membrane protein involved in colicin uptake
MDKLKKQAEELGIKVDGRWSDERLQEEVDAAVAAKASADAEIQAEIEERARVRAAEEEAEQARLAKEAQDQADADALAEIHARERAELDAQAEALKAETDSGSVVIVNLQVNPMKVLGLAGLHSESTITRAQVADPRFAAKVLRAIDLGLIKVK